MDDSSGFSGMAVAFNRHINGCFHVFIQPKGLNKKTGLVIDTADFDLRECSGPMIKKLSEKSKAESIKKRPSPCGQPGPLLRSR